jgi:hypothetical protein
MFRRRREPVDPITTLDLSVLSPRWRAPVIEVVASRGRFVDLVRGVPEGPLRDRLGELGAEVDQGVLAAYDAARRAEALERTLPHLDVDGAAARVKAARRRVADLRARGSDAGQLAEAEQEVEVESERFATLNHLANQPDDIARQLARIDRELDAATAEAATLALAPTGTDAAATVQRAVGQLSALRAALGEV